MNIKKIFGSTVDVMTLSYTERHLKEAYDQENGIPTTILSVIAEKSYNQYNLKSIVSFLEKAFKAEAKDWRKTRNLLKIIEYLLKFGSPELLTSIRKFQSEIRYLQNFSFIESGCDKATIIRETASLISHLLVNYRELDEIREQSRRIREKYTGISSDVSENASRYNNPSFDYKPRSSESHSYNSPPISNYNQAVSNNFQGNDPYSRTFSNEVSNEKNKKIAESLFSGLQKSEENKIRHHGSLEFGNGPAVPHQNYYLKQENSEKNLHKSESLHLRSGNENGSNKPPDIFAGFTMKNKENNKTGNQTDLLGEVFESTPKAPNVSETSNIFFQDLSLGNQKQEYKEQVISPVPNNNSYNKPQVNQKIDIFLNSNNRIGNDHVGNSHIDIFANFSQKKEIKHENFNNAHQSIDLLPSSNDVNSQNNLLFNSNFEPKKQSIDLFQGITQKNKNEPSKNLIDNLEDPFRNEVNNQKEEKIANNTNWNLEFLNLNMNPSNNEKKQVESSRGLPKIKINLQENETVPTNTTKKPNLCPEELEKKLLILDF